MLDRTPANRLPTITTAGSVTLPRMAKIDGIDVSVFQGTIDWQKVAKAGQEFVFIKATEGIPTSSDPKARDSKFNTNWKGSKAAGLIRGAYCYSIPKPDRDPADEVRHLWKVVKAAGGLRYKGDLGLVPDFEWNAPGMTREQLAKWVVGWWKEAERIQGRSPITYTGFWWRDVGLRVKNRECPLWLAAYVDDPRQYVPRPTWTPRDMRFHQYTDKGRVNGIQGDVDRNHFLGTRKALEQLAVLPAFRPAKPSKPKPKPNKPGKPAKPKPPNTGGVKVPTKPKPKPKPKGPRRPADAPKDLPRKFWHHWRYPWGPRARSSALFKRWLWNHGYMSPNFTRAEWACNDGTPVPRSLRRRAQRCAFAFERLRHAIGDKPIYLISKYRTEQYNRDVGGATLSQHVKASAGDMSREWIAIYGHTRVLTLLKRYFDGVGVYPAGSMHGDTRGYPAFWTSF